MNPIAQAGQPRKAAADTAVEATPGRAPSTARPGAEPVLCLCGAAAQVGGRTLWSGVDLEVQAGDFVAVLGQNGVGKSTLVRVLLGVVPAAAGEIRVLGQRPGEACSRVGYLSQRRSFDAGLVRMP
ncbi:ABC-type Mn2+/Zn2+ transport system ATPase subunit [Streptacidiphilus sp. MAP12-20]|uniref:ATP-binding cassette domain-containing protein n=1 Tax=Streptacidiphilus sp. MAP12-20 TaxID=3156299 RepID=UPI003510D91B